MAGTNWKFVLTEFGGTALGEILDADDRQVIRSLSAPSTAAFRIGVDNARATDVLSRDCNLKCYRDNVLLFHGNVLTAQLAGEDATGTPQITVVASDPSWRFDHAVVGQSATGTLYNGSDRFTIVNTELNAINGSFSGLGSMMVQSTGATCGSTAVYTVGPYKKFSEVLADMSSTLSGFDWYVAPIEPTAGPAATQPYLGNLAGGAVVGTTQSNVVFDYSGGRRNSRTPNYIRDISQSMNHFFSVPDDGPTSALGVRSTFDVTFAPWVARGVLQEVVDTSNVTNATLRDAILNDHLLYRKNPRQVVSFQPDFDDGSGRIPNWGVDYGLGDTVRTRILYNNVSLVDGFVRIYKMQFDIDANNRETLTPTVVSET